jgi:Flp pilus assembly CpaE family ATPase
MGVAFLGTLPFDPQVVKACDDGAPVASSGNGGPFVEALDNVVQALTGNL